jgi:hypothetical protein
VTFTVTGTVSGAGSVVNTATVQAPSGVSDSNLANNSATDTDTITAQLNVLPGLGVLDTFNRLDAPGLGNNWRQVSNNIGVDTQQAVAKFAGKAYWNAGAALGSRQGAAFTFANTLGTPADPSSGSSLILKASGTYYLGNYQYFVRVRYVRSAGAAADRVVVETTRNFGGSYTTAKNIILPTGVKFSTGDTLSAWVDAFGVVRVFRTDAATTTFLDSAQLPNSSLWTTRGGRIGLQLPIGSRIDNFKGGNV